MTTIEMIYGGFDPAFIDINIQPINEMNGELINELPPLGSHHTKTKISLIPGGNGFNFCRTLATLGRSITFVGPSSQLYENLIKEHNIPLKVKAIENAEVNYTGILNLLNGEIQFNSVKGQLSVENLSADIIECYRKSPLKSISNIALNPTSIEWISSLVLSLWSKDLLQDYQDKFNPLSLLQEQTETTFEGIIFIDPSDITGFNHLKEFQIFLSELRKLKGEKYLSVNENELRCISDLFRKTPQDLSESLELPIIYHSADEVVFYGKKNIKLSTKKLDTKRTFVGAGDCFNGSFIHSIFDNNSIEDSLGFAIESSSYLIETGKYPS
ncbi:MAG: carbohydrate kinase family protein [Candidatus Heimdallarchaeota archaeon]|nr:carbohydrate kinase family protein [Candidatus Heimdallarchaeota archaeon]